MIIARPKTWEEVLGLLRGFHRVAVVGCSQCATACHFGGEKEIERVCQRLERNGLEAKLTRIMDPCCVGSSVNLGLRAIEQQGEFEVILSLACGDGTQTLARRARVPVMPGNDTLFIGEVREDGSMEEVCRACGACRLGLTAGICPMARCPKKLLNGPCGGAEAGHCEVDASLPCAWIDIYEALATRGRLDLLQGPVQRHDYRRSRQLDRHQVGTEAGG